ncbi:UDP-diphospho-muramoylpentapeptide beta-N-acetylglucosaminyltransferase [Roseivirga seohaensis subsp. aquiponti]|uniref:UDP-N-acetylglucosamine--N-acetylmuramyl-(pentapeptide) pyrophosphoryl-undecaprenol N-acetylglucosamine transferase n=1 Tax=Roseivirga seohaensis subsp. aquiponti TaxID=1566026 RepID=A0A0L8AGT5_9BACT|nr:UDP-diphospho-muramoylpentapeptide beta-N-acetylglucosaminyltransferase [Roseivirga seohaensis subsp. aquiponti]
MISGGGTGGHIYPAIAIANAFKARFDDAEILFVGAEGKMEMQKVPEAGYKIIGLWISGLQRRLTFDNLLFPVKLVNSLSKSAGIIRRFRPHAVVGVGGYASGPLLRVASRKGIPAVIQEQNSYAGLTNKLLAKKVQKICVAYPNMEQFFPANKIAFTGNPVRKDIVDLAGKKEAALKHFGLSDAPVLMILGGSLGARTLNDSMVLGLEKLKAEGVQVIWQCGKFYHAEMKQKLEASGDANGILLFEFLKEMDLAYAAADVVISRAGALSVSELSIAAKPTIFVPSPNVAEDHQTKNAKALVDNDAAILVKDVEARERLIDEAIALIRDQEKQERLSEKIKALAKPNAAEEIVDEILKLIA